MPILHYFFYQCQDPACGLRFPAQSGSLKVERCPRCRSALVRATTLEIEQEAALRENGRSGLILEALLDNIRSAWNVGSMFRTADGTGIQCLYLCGITPTPAHPQVVRTALGAETSIPWQYASNAVELAQSLISNGYRLWALEDTPDSVDLYDLDYEADPRPVLLAVGNEIAGIDPGLLELCERRVSIPMIGRKRSYNVAVAFGIAASYLRYCHSLSQESRKKLPNT
jgi:23S rRNA (guanosine2251-2'-O)-methyltransferase